MVYGKNQIKKWGRDYCGHITEDTFFVLRGGGVDRRITNFTGI